MRWQSFFQDVMLSEGELSMIHTGTSPRVYTLINVLLVAKNKSITTQRLPCRHS